MRNRLRTSKRRWTKEGLTGSQDDNGHGVRIDGPEARDPQTAEVIEQRDSVELAVPSHIPLVASSVVILAANHDLTLLHTRDGVDVVMICGDDVSDVQAAAVAAVGAADGADVVLQATGGDVVELVHRRLGFGEVDAVGERAVEVLREVGPGVEAVVADRRGDGREGLEGAEVCGRLGNSVGDVDGALLCWGVTLSATCAMMGEGKWMVMIDWREVKMLLVLTEDVSLGVLEGAVAVHVVHAGLLMADEVVAAGLEVNVHGPALRDTVRVAGVREHLADVGLLHLVDGGHEGPTPLATVLAVGLLASHLEVKVGKEVVEDHLEGQLRGFAGDVVVRRDIQAGEGLTVGKQELAVPGSLTLDGVLGGKVVHVGHRENLACDTCTNCNGW